MLLVFSNIKQTYTVMVDMSLVGISEGPGVNIAYSRSHFANMECEAARRRIPLGSRIQKPNTYHPRRWACQKRESSRSRRELVGLRALFCEYAIQGAPQPHPTLLAFTNIKQTHTIPVDKVTSPILEGPGVCSLV